MHRFLLIILVFSSSALAGGNPTKLTGEVANKVKKTEASEIRRNILKKDAINSSFFKTKIKAKSSTGEISDYELSKYQYCGVDNDCIVVSNGCCDCANGSEDVSINKDKLEDFKKRFNCLNYSCTKNDPEPRCAGGVVSCISNQCHYFE